MLLFFGGYGVQVGRESYMIPVDATIWKEQDVKREGVSVKSVLEVMKAQGARAKLVVIDASRRNPYERRFRSYSHGLAPIVAPDNALILSSATPGKVAEDSKGSHSVLVAELLRNLTVKGLGADAVFRNTRVAISRTSEGEQVPSVSSSLLEDIRFATADFRWRLIKSPELRSTSPLVGEVGSHRRSDPGEGSLTTRSAL